MGDAGGPNGSSNVAPTRIEVFACDIDGCLAAASHAAYDLLALRRMADLNALSSVSDDVPALTLVTGRPHAYLDAVSQVLGIELAMSFENGAGLATRRPYRARLSSAAEAGRHDLEAFAALVAKTPTMTLQLGKVASLSVFPVGSGYACDQLVADVEAMIGRNGLALMTDPSTDCVNVLVPGVDKGTGFAWLLDEIGVAPEAVAGIGDSVGDVPWLAQCGVSVAPANAVDEVKDAVTRVFDVPDVQAALAAYLWLVEENRRA
ncbi:MAG TPA: HAD hydrolase family protein [Trueperaceae bacterium]|nr:HAD hydrolase family protein [Trueperaceae bacterium]